MSVIKKTKLPDGSTVATGLFYGTCDTISSTAAKSVTCPEFTKDVSGDPGDLVVGNVILVKFTNTNSASNPTLSINSSTAKAIKKQYNTSVSNLSDPGELIGNSTYMFQYNGTYWVLMNSDYGTSTIPTNASLGQGYATCSTATATADKTASMTNYSLQTGGIVSVKFQYAVGDNATLNVNSQGAKNIYYNGVAITAGVIGDGDTATFMYDGTQYHLISVDSGTGGISSSNNTVNNIIQLSESDYANLSPKDPNTLYIVTPDPSN